MVKYKRKDQLRKELLNKKDLACWLEEILGLPRLQKTLKLENSLLGNVPGEKAEGVVKHSFTREIRHLTYEATQPCQQKLETEIGLCRKVLWRTLLSNGMVLRVISRRPTGFWGCYLSRNTAKLDCKGQRQNEIREGYQAFKILQTGNWLIELLNCKHLLLFKELICIYA